MKPLFFFIDFVFEFRLKEENFNRVYFLLLLTRKEESQTKLKNANLLNFFDRVPRRFS